jgi:hypothetical protein
LLQGWLWVTEPLLPCCPCVFCLLACGTLPVAVSAPAQVTTLPPIRPMYPNCTFFCWKPNDEANKVHAENRCSYFCQMLHMARTGWHLVSARLFCTFIWSGSGWRVLGRGWKIMLSFHGELGTGLEGVWSSHPWHLIIHLLYKDIIPSYLKTAFVCFL